MNTEAQEPEDMSAEAVIARYDRERDHALHRQHVEPQGALLMPDLKQLEDQERHPPTEKESFRELDPSPIVEQPLRVTERQGHQVNQHEDTYADAQRDPDIGIGRVGLLPPFATGLGSTCCASRGGGRDRETQTASGTRDVRTGKFRLDHQLHGTLGTMETNHGSGISRGTTHEAETSPQDVMKWPPVIVNAIGQCAARDGGPTTPVPSEA